jgi:hypothetical protein
MMLTVQFSRHASVAVARKLEHNAFNRITERTVALGLCGRV